MKLQSKQTHIILHITNSIPRGSHPYFHKTSKKDSVAHGYGVKGIKEIAKKYHGDVKYDVKDDCVVFKDYVAEIKNKTEICLIFYSLKIYKIFF